MVCFAEPFSLYAICYAIDQQEIEMSELSPLRHIFRAYTRHRPDGTFSAHVSHTVENRPDIVEKIHDVGVAGTEQEAIDEAHAFVAKYVSDRSEYSE
jgi:hypothetical protein